MAWSAERSRSGVRFGFASSRTAAAPATCGEAMLVPEALRLPYGGQASTAVPAVPQVDEMLTPGAVTSG